MSLLVNSADDLPSPYCVFATMSHASSPLSSSRPKVDHSLGGSSGEKEQHQQQPPRVASPSIDNDSKQRALASCAEQHLALLQCLKNPRPLLAWPFSSSSSSSDPSSSQPSDCSSLHREFWSCYERERGASGNLIMAWLASGPRVSESLPRKRDTAAAPVAPAPAAAPAAAASPLSQQQSSL